jgi:hypothetical protein
MYYLKVEVISVDLQMELSNQTVTVWMVIVFTGTKLRFEGVLRWI